MLCSSLAVQSERHVQGQAITVDLTETHPLQPASQRGRFPAKIGYFGQIWCQIQIQQKTGLQSLLLTFGPKLRMLEMYQVLSILENI